MAGQKRPPDCSLLTPGLQHQVNIMTWNIMVVILNDLRKPVTWVQQVTIVLGEIFVYPVSQLAEENNGSFLVSVNNQQSLKCWVYFQTYRNGQIITQEKIYIKKI